MEGEEMNRRYLKERWLNHSKIKEMSDGMAYILNAIERHVHVRERGGGLGRKERKKIV